MSISEIQDGRYIEVNNAFVEVTGYSRESIIGVTSTDLGFITAKERNRLQKTLRTDGRIHDIEVKLNRADGSRLVCLYSAEIIEVEGKKRLLSIANDITGRKRAELERERLAAILAAKNDELEQVFYAASHDLRSPLVNIDGYSKELEYTLQELRGILAEVPKNRISALIPLIDIDIPEALRFIRTSASKMDRLLTGLLRLSRSGRTVLKFEELDMIQILSNVIESMDFQIKETNVKLDIGELPPCHSDAVQVNQIFTNLLDNALKYLDPKRPGIIRIAGKIEGKRSVYCIEDNGIGIAPNQLKKIFEIFLRIDPGAGKGEGLGLTIVKRLVERLEGAVWVESEIGAGSRFYVSFPASRLN